MALIFDFGDIVRHVSELLQALDAD